MSNCADPVQPGPPDTCCSDRNPYANATSACNVCACASNLSVDIIKLCPGLFGSLGRIVAISNAGAAAATLCAHNPHGKQTNAPMADGRIARNTRPITD